jgi:GntR family transcriptional regulator
MTLLPTTSPVAAHASEAVPGQSRYGWLAAKLRASIMGGEWVPGSAIPAETQLAKTYNVALGTMRQAIAVLVTEGLLERVHGRGTFVSSGIGGASLLRFFRFRTTAETANGDAEIPVSRIVEKRTGKASADVAAALNIAARDPVLAITRVRTLGGAPCLFERIWLPLPLFSALTTLNKSQWDDLLYPMFQRACGVTVYKADDSVTFCLGEDEVVQALQLRAKAPCARVERRAFDMGGRCVELRHSFGDALSFHYTAHLR